MFWWFFGVGRGGYIPYFVNTRQKSHTLFSKGILKLKKKLIKPKLMSYKVPSPLIVGFQYACIKMNLWHFITCRIFYFLLGVSKHFSFNVTIKLYYILMFELFKN